MKTNSLVLMIAALLPVCAATTAVGQDTGADPVRTDPLMKKLSDAKYRLGSSLGADFIINSGVVAELFSGTTFSISGDVTNSGTFTSGAGSTVEFNGATDQALSGVAIFSNLTKSGAGTLTPGNPVTVNDTLTIKGGIIDNSTNNITIGAGGTIVRGTGTLSSAPSLTTPIDLSYTGSTVVTTGNELPANNTDLNDLTVDGAGVILSANATVNGVLALNNGVLSTGSNKVVVNNNLPAGVFIPATSGSITGKIERAIAAGNTGVYKFTNTNTYIKPGAAQPAASVSITSFPNTWPVPAANQTGAIKRYYTISPTPSNFMAQELGLEYTDAENVNSIPELSLALFRNDQTLLNWINMGGVPDAANNFVVGFAISAWSNWALGDASNPLPIVLVSFTAHPVPGRPSSVLLEWRTLSEINNYGFYVQRRQGETAWAEIPNSFIAGHGTTNEPHAYSLTDPSASRGSWSYRLRQVDLDGTEHFTEAVTVNVLTTVEEVAPREFSLKQNYPNPFNPSTEIKFSVENTERASVQVFNLLGQKIATLFDDVAEAGQYYRVRFDGATLASGVYLYRLQSGKKNELKKLLFLR